MPQSTRSSDFMPDHLRTFAATSARPGVDQRSQPHLHGLSTACRRHTVRRRGCCPTSSPIPLGTPASGCSRASSRDRTTAPMTTTPAAIRGASAPISSSPATRAPGPPCSASPPGSARRPATTPATSEVRLSAQRRGQRRRRLSLDGVRRAARRRGPWPTAGNQAWLNAVWDLVEATSIDDGGALRTRSSCWSMIVMSGNWWTPQAVFGRLRPTASARRCVPAAGRARQRRGEIRRSLRRPQRRARRTRACRPLNCVAVLPGRGGFRSHRRTSPAPNSSSRTGGATATRRSTS